MADIACTYAEWCSRPAQLIPIEYQGWFVLLLLFFGTVAILYALYLMLGEKPNV